MAMMKDAPLRMCSSLDRAGISFGTGHLMGNLPFRFRPVRMASSPGSAHWTEMSRSLPIATSGAFSPSDGLACPSIRRNIFCWRPPRTASSATNMAARISQPSSCGTLSHTTPTGQQLTHSLSAQNRQRGEPFSGGIVRLHIRVIPHGKSAGRAVSYLYGTEAYSRKCKNHGKRA